MHEQLANHQTMTFPIEKKINIELLTDRTATLYTAEA